MFTKESKSIFPKEYALPTSDLKACPIVGIGVGTSTRGQFLSVGLHYLLSLNCIKTIGPPAYSDKLTCVYCHMFTGECFRSFRKVIR